MVVYLLPYPPSTWTDLEALFPYIRFEYTSKYPSERVMVEFTARVIYAWTEIFQLKMLFNTIQGYKIDHTRGQYICPQDIPEPAWPWSRKVDGIMSQPQYHYWKLRRRYARYVMDYANHVYPGYSLAILSCPNHTKDPMEQEVFRRIQYMIKGSVTGYSIFDEIPCFYTRNKETSP